MTAIEELLPCPYCGGEALVCQGGISGRHMTYGLVEHRDGCFFLADGLPTKNQRITQKDFSAWNRRTAMSSATDFACGRKVVDA